MEGRGVKGGMKGVMSGRKGELGVSAAETM